MNDEPQCKTRADLHRKWDDVLEMCEAAGFDKPWKCVKYGSDACGAFPNFGGDPIEYEFALAIVEGRPVFRGDVLWSNGWDQWITVIGLYACNDGGTALAFEDNSPSANAIAANCTWTQPKPATIEVNGVKVKVPDEVGCDEDSPSTRQSEGADLI